MKIVILFIFLMSTTAMASDDVNNRRSDEGAVILKAGFDCVGCGLPAYSKERYTQIRQYENLMPDESATEAVQPGADQGSDGSTKKQK